MLAQGTTRFATPAETSAVGDLMVEPEAAVSGAPVPSPEASMILLVSLLLSPKEPKEPKGK
ncbi:hypothetical protein SNS2_3182 [Streptomyces netropsis]|uniref:PEP-CTERM protein-sorting domain-containing protein n=1 Tax=Streptomyces syringium TaxID=76729 RepID=A0ABS4Y707_9ACTN|nr:hypothetical protein [Streptomyces syringium]MBP2404568.1 hypothetical protein [Streptomyces syringium]SPE57511.1 hypothetical protein SNS2_3182 [Streptomyces netropsis]